jgi:hypothetical protein
MTVTCPFCAAQRTPVKCFDVLIVGCDCMRPDDFIIVHPSFRKVAARAAQETVTP